MLNTANCGPKVWIAPAEYCMPDQMRSLYCGDLRTRPLEDPKSRATKKVP